MIIYKARAATPYPRSCCRGPGLRVVSGYAAQLGVLAFRSARSNLLRQCSHLGAASRPLGLAAPLTPIESRLGPVLLSDDPLSSFHDYQYKS